MQQAMQKIPSLSEADQDEVAKIILEKADPAPVELTEAEQAAIAEGHEQIEAGEFAPAGTVERLLAKLRSA